MSNFYYSGWPEEANGGAQSHNTTTTIVQEPSCPLPPHVSTSFQFHGFPSWSIPIEEEGVSEDRGASASKSHSQAEKRRRDRINAHLSTLRKLIPKSEKMDKAALLGSVIDHVKDLKRKAMEVGQVFTVPTEVDEVTVEYGCCDQDIGTSSSNKGKENLFIKASVCCDDRPELFSELIKALNGLRLTTVRADMASLGGRTKSILVLCPKDAEEGASVSNLKQSLRVVLSRIASSSMASNFRISSKRQRFFLPSNYSQ